MILDVRGVFNRSLLLGRRACMQREDGVMRSDNIIWQGVERIA